MKYTLFHDYHEIKYISLIMVMSLNDYEIIFPSIHVECRCSVVTCAKYYICDAADMNVLIISFTFKIGTCLGKKKCVEDFQTS